MNRNSSFRPPTKPVGGGRFRIMLLGFLIAAPVLAIGSLAFLWISSPVPKNKSVAEADSRDSSNSDVPFSSPSSSIWPDQPDVSPQTESTNPMREFSAEVMDHVSRFETPTVKEVIERLHELGDYSGIGAFNPPGSRPAMIGLAVPEDFVLPKGFVRHHQATDDGQRIEAILMFAPDYDHRDAYNQPVAVPKDRVVPPDLAPPGLPNRQIVIPKPIEPEEYEL